MIAALALLAAAATAPTATAPTPAAIADARTIAANGTMATLLPLIAAKEADELVAAHPELSATERDELEAVARQTASAGIARIGEAEAQALAVELSPADLATLAAAARSDAVRNLNAAMPAVIGKTMTLVGNMRFKEDTLAAFCKRSGKLCAR